MPKYKVVLLMVCSVIVIATLGYAVGKATHPFIGFAFNSIGSFLVGFLGMLKLKAKEREVER